MGSMSGTRVEARRVARRAIVEMLPIYARDHGWRRAVRTFVEDYNAGLVFIGTVERAAFPCLTKSGVYNWLRMVREGGWVALDAIDSELGQHRRGSGVFDRHVYLRACLKDHYRRDHLLSAEKARDRLQDIAVEKGCPVPSSRTVSRELSRIAGHGRAFRRPGHSRRPFLGRYPALVPMIDELRRCRPKASAEVLRDMLKGPADAAGLPTPSVRVISRYMSQF